MSKECISDLIQDYTALNRLYQAVAISGHLFFEQQRNITEFWNLHHDTPLFEELLLQTISKEGYQRADALFRHLSEVITENRAIYMAHQRLFDAFDTLAICQKFADRFRDQIQKQTDVTTAAHRLLVEADNRLDYLSLDPDDAECADAQRHWQDAKERHDAAQRQLQLLYALSEQARQEVIDNIKSRFAQIHELCGQRLTMLERYITRPEPRPHGKAPAVASSSADEGSPAPFTEYFPMTLLAEIHAACVKGGDGEEAEKQFEAIPVVDFYYAFNLSQVSHTLTIAHDEKVRVCYLLRRLRDRLPASRREGWITAMLEQLRINRGTFTSKSCEVSKRYASQSNVSFASKIDTLLKRHGQP